MQTNNPPLLSIITASKNRAEFLPILFKSIEEQKIKNFEHILIDGNSSDESLKVIEDYKERNKGIFNVKYIQSEPKGIADGMNQGIPLANGQYLLFVQSDDYFSSQDSTQKIDSFIAARTNCKWIIGEFRFTKARGYFAPSLYFMRRFRTKLLALTNLISHQNSLFHRSVFEKCGHFDKEIVTNMDYDFYMKLLANGFRPDYINENFVTNISHNQSESFGKVTLVKLKRAIAVRRAIQKKYAGLIDWKSV